MIRFKHVTKTYGAEVALSNVNFSVAAGEMCFLTGHSGAGKTTILKLLSCIETPTRGNVYINDTVINHLSKKQIPLLRRHIGIIFQNPILLTHSTVFENVAIPLIVAGFKEREIQRRVQAALAKVELLKKINCFPQELSCGEQQRIGIARAVVNKPAILIADEPTGNLDHSLSKDIFSLFDAFNAVGVTVLIATHDLTLINPLKHRVIELIQGEIKHEQESVATVI